MGHLWGTCRKGYHCSAAHESRDTQVAREIHLASIVSDLMWFVSRFRCHSVVLRRSSAQTWERCVARARSPVLEVLRNNSARSPRRASYRCASTVLREGGRWRWLSCTARASGGSSPLLHSCCQGGAIPAFLHNMSEISRNKIEWYRGLKKDPNQHKAHASIVRLEQETCMEQGVTMRRNENEKSWKNRCEQHWATM